MSSNKDNKVFNPSKDNIINQLNEFISELESRKKDLQKEKNQLLLARKDIDLRLSPLTSEIRNSQQKIDHLTQEIKQNQEKLEPESKKAEEEKIKNADAAKSQDGEGGQFAIPKLKKTEGKGTNKVKSGAASAGAKPKSSTEKEASSSMASAAAEALKKRRAVIAGKNEKSTVLTPIEEHTNARVTLTSLISSYENKLSTLNKTSDVLRLQEMLGLEDIKSEAKTLTTAEMNVRISRLRRADQVLTGILDKENLKKENKKLEADNIHTVESPIVLKKRLKERKSSIEKLTAELEVLQEKVEASERQKKLAERDLLKTSEVPLASSVPDAPLIGAPGSAGVPDAPTAPGAAEAPAAPSAPDAPPVMGSFAKATKASTPTIAPEKATPLVEEPKQGGSGPSGKPTLSFAADIARIGHVRKILANKNLFENPSKDLQLALMSLNKDDKSLLSNPSVLTEVALNSLNMEALTSVSGAISDIIDKQEKEKNARKPNLDLVSKFIPKWNSYQNMAEYNEASKALMGVFKEKIRDMENNLNVMVEENRKETKRNQDIVLKMTAALQDAEKIKEAKSAEDEGFEEELTEKEAESNVRNFLKELGEMDWENKNLLKLVSVVREQTGKIRAGGDEAQSKGMLSIMAKRMEDQEWNVVKNYHDLNQKVQKLQHILEARKREGQAINQLKIFLKEQGDKDWNRLKTYKALVDKINSLKHEKQKEMDVQSKAQNAKQEEMSDVLTAIKKDKLPNKTPVECLDVVSNAQLNILAKKMTTAEVALKKEEALRKAIFDVIFNRKSQYWEKMDAKLGSGGVTTTFMIKLMDIIDRMGNKPNMEEFFAELDSNELSAIRSASEEAVKEYYTEENNKKIILKVLTETEDYESQHFDKLHVSINKFFPDVEPSRLTRKSFDALYKLLGKEAVEEIVSAYAQGLEALRKETEENARKDARVAAAASELELDQLDIEPSIEKAKVLEKAEPVVRAESVARAEPTVAAKRIEAVEPITAMEPKASVKFEAVKPKVVKTTIEEMPAVKPEPVLKTVPIPGEVSIEKAEPVTTATIVTSEKIPITPSISETQPKESITSTAVTPPEKVSITPPPSPITFAAESTFETKKEPTLDSDTKRKEDKKQEKGSPIIVSKGVKTRDEFSLELEKEMNRTKAKIKEIREKMPKEKKGSQKLADLQKELVFLEGQIASQRELGMKTLSSDREIKREDLEKTLSPEKKQEIEFARGLIFSAQNALKTYKNTLWSVYNNREKAVVEKIIQELEVLQKNPQPSLKELLSTVEDLHEKYVKKHFYQREDAGLINVLKGIEDTIQSPKGPEGTKPKTKQ